MDGRAGNCWVRKVMEVVVFVKFVMAVAALGGKYAREAELLKFKDPPKKGGTTKGGGGGTIPRENLLYAILALDGLIVLLLLLLFCKPITRNKNPLNCMLLTVVCFLSAFVAFLVTLYLPIMDTIIGYCAAIFASVFVIFYASICQDRDITTWYMSFFTIVLCFGVAAAMLYFAYASDPEFTYDTPTALRLSGLIPNFLMVVTIPFLLPFLSCRREGMCGEVIEAALYILYPWLILYDPFTRATDWSRPCCTEVLVICWDDMPEGEYRRSDSGHGTSADVGTASRTQILAK
ncbi:unnamed protein product [Bemisia tabaci]|uniref:Uncharacterized protein n=1 Tax=Bemisia tabaci TaxID=7038 RepID=A0A9P0EY50_BEMTA|nr:unnamed protein product [Bemisia tabaci]